MSALPERVRRQAELANQLATKAKTGTLTLEDVNSTPSSVQMPPAPNPQPVMPSGFNPQPAGNAAVPGLNQPGFNPQPPAAPTPPAQSGAPAPTAQPQSPQPDDQAEHRYRVLQGKYNAEVPRLQQQNRELQQNFQAMQNQLSATQALLASIGQQPQAPNLPQPSAPPQLVTPKEVTEFGADLYDFVKRAAQEVVGPQVHSLEERFRPVAQTVQQLAPAVQQNREDQQRTAQEVAHEKMCNGLDELAPGWETINTSPEFQAWLDTVDPYAGAKRGAMLAQAYGNGNVTRVAAFFTGFQNEHAAVAPTGQQAQQTAQGNPPAATPTVALASLAAPGTGVGGPSAAGTPPESGQPRVYTQAEIGAFYRDVARGVYRGRDADKVAIERDIFAAQKSGRVRP
jgi:hypothetical protein